MAFLEARSSEIIPLIFQSFVITSSTYIEKLLNLARQFTLLQLVEEKNNAYENSANLCCMCVDPGCRTCQRVRKKAIHLWYASSWSVK